MYVFVYGTLKRGYGNNRVLGQSRFIGRATTLWPFFMKSAGFPVLFRTPETANVEGELFEVNSQHIMAALDRLEGVPHMYERSRTIVDCPEIGQQIEAFIYLGNRDSWTHIDRMPDVPVTASGTYVWGDAREV